MSNHVFIDHDPDLGGRPIKYRYRDGVLEFWSSADSVAGDSLPASDPNWPGRWSCPWRAMLVLEDDDAEEILERCGINKKEKA